MTLFCAISMVENMSMISFCYLVPCLSPIWIYSPSQVITIEAVMRCQLKHGQAAGGGWLRLWRGKAAWALSAVSCNAAGKGAHGALLRSKANSARVGEGFF